MQDKDFDFERFEALLDKAADAMEQEAAKPHFDQLAKAYRKNAELADEVLRQQSSWLRYLVTTISVVFGICEAIGYICFGLALLVLSAYMILQAVL